MGRKEDHWPRITVTDIDHWPSYTQADSYWLVLLDMISILSFVLQKNVYLC